MLYLRNLLLPNTPSLYYISIPKVCVYITYVVSDEFLPWRVCCWAPSGYPPFSV